MALYKKYAETRAIGGFALCNFGGVEILDIINDDCAIVCFNFGTGRQKIRRHKIYASTSGRMYIRKENVRYYLDQFLKY